MASALDESAHRAMRSDAQRNYNRLVVAAREVFAPQGSDASMEAIALQAGVGAGTLYRHFPSRIDLVEAVYRNDVEELMLAAEKAVANFRRGRHWSAGSMHFSATPSASEYS